MSFLLSRVLTNCQKWLTTCQKWWTTCQKWWTTCLQTVKKWWFIDIQSILPIDYRKNQYNRTINGPSKTSNEFYLQREHIDRQTNRRQRCFLYIIKKIYSYTTNDSIYIHGWVLHTHSTNKQKQNIEPPPVAPVDKVLTHRPYAQTHKQASAFSTSAFFERGSSKWVILLALFFALRAKWQAQSDHIAVFPTTVI